MDHGSSTQLNAMAIRFKSIDIHNNKKP